MKTFKNSAIFLCALIVIVGTASCGKKWKKPAAVSYQFRLKENSSSGLVNFTEGLVRVSNMKFYGDRKQGQKHVEMAKSFDPALVIPLSLTPTSTDIQFDIPQGTYHEIEMEASLSGQMGIGASVVIQGYYIKNNTPVPVKFEYYSSRTIKAAAHNSSGDPEIVLIEDQPASATVLLNPNQWFQEVPQSMFEDAELTASWGDSIMMISPEHNVDIYKMVIDRIENGNEVVF
jgi:hypothetical protein